MSFLGLGASDLTEKQIDKISKLAANPFAQPDVRREQMEKLIRDGSEASIRGLLQRLTVNASQGIADEDEKRFVVEELIAMGKKAVPPILQFLKRETNLTFAAHALLGILPKDEGLGELLALFDVYSPDDYRSDEQKRQLVLLFKEHDDPRIAPALVPYLLDHSDDVRHQVLEYFAEKKMFDSTVAAAVGQLIRDKDTSPRIARQAAEIAADHDWQLAGDSTINGVLDQEFFLDKKGFVRRRVTPQQKR